MKHREISLKSVLTELSSKIQPFFEQGILRFRQTTRVAYIGQADITGPSWFELPRYPSLQSLNAGSEDLKSSTFKGAIKHCDCYINDTFPFLIEEIEYYSISKLRESLFSNKKYSALSHYIPIYIESCGEARVAAYLHVLIWIPKEVCNNIANDYLGRYSKKATLTLAAKGPARLSGGYDGSELRYRLNVYAESSSVLSVE